MKKLLTLLLATLFAGGIYAAELPHNIYSGLWKAGHVQGIAVDTAREHIYFSFTTILVKTDLEGNVIGTVEGLLGHLGCIEFNDEDGRLYGSLEYKNDSIGKGILAREKSDKVLECAFYVAIFDVAKITRTGMSAEKDGIMTTVYLPTVLEDHLAKVPTRLGKESEHRFCCSGFDGISFGPRFGSSDGKRYLTVAYGIYGNTEREDNDYQVLLQYDTRDWNKFEAPLSQDGMHHNGPAKPGGQYFVYTGNTSWGIQNLEYDAEHNLWFMAAYKGKKTDFANFRLFVVDGSKAPVNRRLQGVKYQKRGKVLSLLERGLRDPKHPTVFGWHFKYGATGICSLGDNLFYISHNGKTKQKEQFCNAKLYRYVGTDQTPFKLVE